MIRPSTLAASATLATIAGLHVAWGMGSSFPFGTRAELADAVAGRPDVPPPPACYSVAAALVVASALTLDVPIGPPPLRRAGRLAVAGALAVRGALGMAGHTDLLVPGSSSPRFQELDRRYFAPLCLTLSRTIASIS